MLCSKRVKLEYNGIEIFTTWKRIPLYLTNAQSEYITYISRKIVSKSAVPGSALSENRYQVQAVNNEIVSDKIM